MCIQWFSIHLHLLTKKIRAFLSKVVYSTKCFRKWHKMAVPWAVHCGWYQSDDTSRPTLPTWLRFMVLGRREEARHCAVLRSSTTAGLLQTDSPLSDDSSQDLPGDAVKRSRWYSFIHSNRSHYWRLSLLEKEISRALANGLGAFH